MVNIYALINSMDNNVFYIGATLYPRERLCNHLATAKHMRCEKSKEIFRIIKSGGSVEMLILDSCRNRDTKFMENFYMDLFRSFGFNLFQWQKSTYKINNGHVRTQIQIEEINQNYIFTMSGDFFGETISVSCKMPLRKVKNPYADADFYLRGRLLDSINFIRKSYGLKPGLFTDSDILEKDEIDAIRDSKKIVAERIKKKIREYNYRIPDMFNDYHIFNNIVK